MRIITGLAKGCKLKTPKGQETRPTADRIKESLFNILAGDVYEKMVLDIFAGTGNLGLEALSRGAIGAVFVDQSSESIKVINENAIHTKLADKAEIIRGDVFATMQKLERSGHIFSLVFCDPPYNKDLCQRALSFLDQSKLLAEDALVVIEHAREDELDMAFSTLQLLRNQVYGATTQLSIFRRSSIKEAKEEKQ